MGGKIPTVILMRDELPNSPDYAMIVGRILFTVNLTVSIPIVGNPLRKQIWSTFNI